MFLLIIYPLVRAESVYHLRRDVARGVVKVIVNCFNIDVIQKPQSSNPQKLIRVIYRFKIQDDRIGQDDLAAWACIRLDRLRGGYRFVHLLDGAGFESKGVLLVYIQKTLM